MRWPWSRAKARAPQVAVWDPGEREHLVARLAGVAASHENRLVILAVQKEGGSVGVSVWASQTCATNVEAVGLATHTLEAMKRRNADWWDRE